MLSASLFRFGLVFVALFLSVALVSAAPPPGKGGGGAARPAPAAVRPAPAPARPVAPATNFRPSGGGTRVVIGLGLGGGGLYSPFGYSGGFGGYSPLYSGLGSGYRYYGGLGYNSGYFGSSILPSYNYYSVPYSVPYSTPYQVLPAQPFVEPIVEPEPTPLPLPLPGAAPAAGEARAAKITVVTNEGAKVTFDGIESEGAGPRHSFTTRPIAAGTEIRVKVQVDGSTITLGVKAGETATVDMRK